MTDTAFELPKPFGLLNINKPADWTSRDVVNRVAKRFRKIKVGHAGTLDPMASGVLVVCVGPATRLIEYVQSQEKEYISTFVLGQTSDTDDVTGKILSRTDAKQITSAQIEAALKSFQGKIQQVPPQYSAVHVNGERAYRLARQGEQVEIPSREVVIHEIELLGYSCCELQLRIVCGSGTYIRSIARDLGEQLGCGGLMSGLVRTRIGLFSQENALSVDDLLEEDLESRLIEPTAAVAHLSSIILDDQQLGELLHGRILELERMEFPTGQSVRLCIAEDQLTGIGVVDNGRIRPKIVFVRSKNS